MNKETNIIFDFDNLLVATNQFVIDHLAETCQKLGDVPPPAETITLVQRKNLPFEEIFTQLFGEKGAGILVSYRETAMETLYKPTEGGVEFVKTAFENGVEMVIASNRTRMLPERLEQAGYQKDWFKGIVECDPKKPTIGAYDKAMAFFGDRKRIVVFGDHTDDFLACGDDIKSGFVAVLTGENKAEDFEKLGLAADKIWPKLEAQRLSLI